MSDWLSEGQMVSSNSSSRIGEPDIYVEMILPSDAYAAFCEINRPEELPPRDTLDESGLGLSLSQAVKRLS